WGGEDGGAPEVGPLGERLRGGGGRPVPRRRPARGGPLRLRRVRARPVLPPPAGARRLQEHAAGAVAGPGAGGAGVPDGGGGGAQPPPLVPRPVPHRRGGRGGGPGLFEGAGAAGGGARSAGDGAGRDLRSGRARWARGWCTRGRVWPRTSRPA